MPTPTKGARLGGSPAHQRMILSNLATALFEHGRITTTEAKARRLRPFAEKLITKAKRGDLHARRQVLSVIRDKGVVHELFAEIGPRYATRPGGYTRITKLGPRKGDNAPMAVIALVEERDFDLATRRPSEVAAAPVAQDHDTGDAEGGSPGVAGDGPAGGAEADAEGGTGAPVPAEDAIIAGDDTGSPIGADTGSSAVDDTGAPAGDDADQTGAPADDGDSPVDGDIAEEQVPTVAGDGSSPADSAEPDDDTDTGPEGSQPA